MQPLEGLVVLDFSTLLPGPMASLLLAQAGAEVIKVERRGIGDETRHYPGEIGGESALFAILNAGKDSLELDLKSDADRAMLEPYLARADVLLEQFRPGVMDRLGLGYDALRQRFPGLIYCSITGYGQTGPRAAEAGHDLNYIAQAGLLSLSMGPSEAPVVPPALIADIAGGAYPAVMNILLALEARRRGGTGAHLDISMSDNMFPLAWWALAQRAATGQAPGNADQRLSGGTARYHLYPCSDGQIVAAAPLEDRFWHVFCDAIGLDDTLRDEADAQATLEAVSTIIAARPGPEWAAIFAQADCCCCLVQSLDAALADPHFVARGIGQTRQPIGDTEMAALPLPLAPSFRSSAVKAAPKLGSLNPER
jgi:crotonobetainyl-CoA:carnitine CoA-transferase CaiB-like acyl-CoA transferase